MKSDKKNRINEIVRERRAMTPDTALRLARYFDTTAQFWLNLQSSFDLKRAEKEPRPPPPFFFAGDEYGLPTQRTCGEGRRWVIYVSSVQCF